MSTEEPRSVKELAPKRQYPRAYEKVVPIALVLIALAIVVLLGIIVVVATGLYPGG